MCTKEEKKYEKRAEEIYEGKKNQKRITKSKKKYSFFLQIIATGKYRTMLWIAEQ